jgi:DNA-binding CsgD family transcriptional regulator
MVADGDLHTGCSLLREAASLGEEIGDLTGAAAALHGIARLGRAREVAAPLAALSKAVEGCLTPARSAHADALAANDPEAIGVVVDAFAAMGADLLAAEAAADAAVAWQRAGGSRQRANAAQVRARVLADRCEGAQTPALQSAGARAKLTPAEYEAVMLAANGRSNKQIAERLYLSVRSVEGRLLRAFPKLGVTSRAELVSALEATGLRSRTGAEP